MRCHRRWLLLPGTIHHRILRCVAQTLFAQLYVNSDRQRNLDYIRKLEAGGVSALFITVDAPALGRREKDMRMKV